MNKIFSIVLIAVLLITAISLASCKKEEPECGHHDFIDEVVDSTCEEKGYVSHVCSVCGYMYKDNYSEEHHFVDTLVAPTCNKEGYTKRVCSDCGYEKRENITPVDSKNHVAFEWVSTVAPTCTEFGYDIEACMDCSYQHRANYTAPAHSWSHTENEEWPLASDVTCFDHGVRRRTCTVEGCGALEEVIELEPSHVQDNFTVSSANGLMTYYCDCGNFSYTTDEYVDVLALELMTAEDGTQYYVVKGFKEGMKNPTFYVPFSVDNILVTEIAANAFMNNTDLESVRIAVTVTKIGTFAFSGCTGLKTINYDGTMAQWNAINFVDGWNYGAGNFTVICSDGVINQ